jgi:hypothetical protein
VIAARSTGERPAEEQGISLAKHDESATKLLDQNSLSSPKSLKAWRGMQCSRDVKSRLSSDVWGANVETAKYFNAMHVPGLGPIPPGSFSTDPMAVPGYKAAEMLVPMQPIFLTKRSNHKTVLED